MEKSDLFELIEAVRGILIDELPVIVGSQATFALTDDPPEIALESVECDFLIHGDGSSDLRDRINDELGVLTPFQREKGYFADALGLATVVLAKGWQDRLQPLFNAENEIVAYCLEIHDVATSKLIAGRDKDLDFLFRAISMDLVSPPILVGRIMLASSHVENDTIPNRVTRFIAYLKRQDAPLSTIAAFRKFLEDNH